MVEHAFPSSAGTQLNKYMHQCFQPNYVALRNKIYFKCIKESDVDVTSIEFARNEE